MCLLTPKFTQIGPTYPPGHTAGIAATFVIATSVVCLEFLNNKRFPTAGIIIYTGAAEWNLGIQWQALEN